MPSVSKGALIHENILPFTKITLNDLPNVGGKNASLGEMIRHLSGIGIKVPNGFATTSFAYHSFLSKNHLAGKIAQLLSSVTVEDIAYLNEVTETIRHWILSAPFSLQFETDITHAYQTLDGQSDLAVAVRSSATSEDLPEASFAGQQDTFLHVKGADNVLSSIKKVFASLFTERAIIYRLHHHIQHDQLAISAGIQRMVHSDEGVSGVMFTLDTESGFDQVILINASYGLGEGVVQGVVNPDEFCVFKPFVQQRQYAILSKKLGEKRHKVVQSSNHGETKTLEVSEEAQGKYCLNDQEIMQLAGHALSIEKHYGRPMDIEWAKDRDDSLYILQARPETVVTDKSTRVIEQFHLEGQGKLLTSGRSVGQKIGQGAARVILDPKQMAVLHAGEVLVTDRTDPDWEPVMKKASAIVTNRGGRTCHAAIVARELGIPAVVGCRNATTSIASLEPITVSCAEGETGYIYAGLLPIKKDQQVISDMPPIPVNLCLNIGNPEQAFFQQFLPNQGVGLARIEFIISQMIGIHPNAILNLDQLPDTLCQEIVRKTAAYSSPQEFYIEKLREGMATIAAAFYPKEVIFRFSDFKSNEYRNLLGGKLFEPMEENPMIGFRGAARYLTENFKACFLLECEAFKRVRDKSSLTNAQIMIPFAHTVDELVAVIDLMQAAGLKRGENQLRIYMMCEIPSNVLLADTFLAHVDGFSIGSNDLTQLTLGIDRDSELVSASFDERNPAVKIFLQAAIAACQRHQKYVGICGQAPSDYPEFAQWLVEQGIDSISLSPDSIIATWHLLNTGARHGI